MGQRKENPQAIVVNPDLQEKRRSGKRRRGTADEIAMTLLFLKSSSRDEEMVMSKAMLGRCLDDSKSGINLVDKKRRKEEHSVVCPVTDDEEEDRHGVTPVAKARFVATKKSGGLAPYVQQAKLMPPPMGMALSRPPVLATFHPITGLPIKTWRPVSDLPPIDNLPQGKPLPPAPRLPNCIIQRKPC